MKYLLFLIYNLYLNIITLVSGCKIKLSKNKPNIIMLMSPDYGNIGDLAIEYSQEIYLGEQLPKHNIISIEIKDTYKYLKSIRKQLSDKDLICLIGGGNFGGLYPAADRARIFILNYFRSARILSMPQSYTNSGDDLGKYLYRKYSKMSNKCIKTTYFARDEKSFAIMQNIFSHRTKISPDIVLYLHSIYKNKPMQRRSGIVLTLRNDKEKNITDRNLEKLLNIIERQKHKITFYDTGIANQDYNNSKKKLYINNILKKYRTSSLVVTDRLHGMIFSFITGTPCVVIDNKNHKIKSTYNTWLKQSNYVHFIERFDESEFEHYMLKYISPNFKTNFLEMTIKFAELTNYLKKIENGYK